MVPLLYTGEYFLWGHYNKHPVYQHYSGLDFIYYHKNSVWGIGPKDWRSSRPVALP
jgi:hypothetical protein